MEEGEYLEQQEEINEQEGEYVEQEEEINEQEGEYVEQQEQNNYNQDQEEEEESWEEQDDEEIYNGEEFKPNLPYTQEHIKDNQIKIYNLLDEDVNVRVHKGITGTADYKTIPAGGSSIWKRASGNYYTEIQTVTGREPFISNYFACDTGIVYQIGKIEEEENIILYDENEEEMISCDEDCWCDDLNDFYDNNEDFQDSNNNEKKDKNQNPQIPESNPLIKKDNIVIINSFGTPLWVRMEVWNIGSEDYSEMKPGETDNYGRLPGSYHTEFTSRIKTKEFKKKYYLEPLNFYTMQADGKLINGKTNAEVQATNDPWPGEKKKIVVDPNVKYFNDKPPSVPEKGLFTDKDFPPEARVLNALDSNGERVQKKFGGELDEDPEGKKNPEEYCFKRVSEIFPNGYSLFDDKIEPADIKQGSVGDCWLMSGLAALSTNPGVIQSIFKSKSVNKQGYYEIYYYEDGIKRVMFIDDYIVCWADSNDTAFGKPNGNEIWVLLLEKCVAKLEGGYRNIDGGFISNVFKIFLGAESKYLNPVPSDDEGWQELYKSHKDGKFLGAASHSATGKTDKDYSAGGICYGHAYSVIAMKEYQGIRLLALRNPWGQGEWNGGYSDDSHLWNAELKKAFGYQIAMGDNGLFFMPYEKLNQEFQYLEITEM